MVDAISPAPDWNLDWFRHCRELIDPSDYLDRPYFDQWLQSLLRDDGELEVATVEELASGKATFQPEGLTPAHDAGAGAAREARRVALRCASGRAAAVRRR